METVLIIEDDAAMMRGLKDNFEQQGYTVLTATDGEKGLDTALDTKPNLIILDIMLPKINGYEICRLIRKENLDIPIIMLTAKGEESDVILGLNLGADDYVTKPFSIKELLARSNAFLRRRREKQEVHFKFGPYLFDPASCTLTKNGKPVKLTPKEFKLLEYFLHNPGRVLTRDTLLNQVWGYSTFVSQRSVDRCVATLRNKIESNPQNPKYIYTVWEFGYKFDMPSEAE
jgi:DNA-binding response OmpR family regulator